MADSILKLSDLKNNDQPCEYSDEYNEVSITSKTSKGHFLSVTWRIPEIQNFAPFCLTATDWRQIQNMFNPPKSKNSVNDKKIRK